MSAGKGRLSLRLVSIEGFSLALALSVLRLSADDFELGAVQAAATAVVAVVIFRFMRGFAGRMTAPEPVPPPLVRTTGGEVILVLIVIAPGLLLDYFGGHTGIIVEIIMSIGMPLVFGTTIGLGAFLVWLLFYEARHGRIEMKD